MKHMMPITLNIPQGITGAAATFGRGEFGMLGNRQRWTGAPIVAIAAARMFVDVDGISAPKRWRLRT